MKEKELEYLFGTGWHSDAELFYHGFIYWCEGTCDFETQVSNLLVYRFRAENENDEVYHAYGTEDNKFVDYEVVLDYYTHEPFDSMKRVFFTAPIFEGKRFWQVEKDLLWLDKSSDITIHDRSEIKPF